jgi:hypothetical protein
MAALLRIIARPPVVAFMVIGLGASFLAAAIRPIAYAEVLPFDLPLADGLTATWQATAAEIQDDILEHGVDKRGVLASTTTRMRWMRPRSWQPSSDSYPQTTSGSAQACSPSRTS